MDQREIELRNSFRTKSGRWSRISTRLRSANDQRTAPVERPTATRVPAADGYIYKPSTARFGTAFPPPEN